MCRRHTLLILCVALLALLLAPPPAEACSCGIKPTVLEAYEQATFVVLVQVVSVEKAQESERSADGVRSTDVIVERVFKGSLKAGEAMTFAQGGGADCIWTFDEKDIGQRFLFYLSKPAKEQKLWWAGTCGRSRNTEYAADDLLYLENMAKARGKTRLSGTLKYFQASPIEEQESINRSVHGNKIRITGPTKTYELTTNHDGVYEIYDLPTGNYVIHPEVPDGLVIDYALGSSGRHVTDQRDDVTPNKVSFRVAVEAGKHAYVDFGYRVNNAIRGKILDSAGNGMKDVCLTLVPNQGKPAKYFFATDCTDKDGAFEIIGIPPGTYVIAINKDGKISSSEPFPTFYYPNVFERDKAAVIMIGAGQMLEQIHIFVPMMEETITVEGVCVYSDGRPVVQGSVQFEPDSKRNGVDGRARAVTDSTGRFAIKILKGQRGKLYGEMHAYSGQYVNCPELEELLKASSNIVGLRTNVIAIRSDQVLANAELKYAFRGCKKAQ